MEREIGMGIYVLFKTCCHYLEKLSVLITYDTLHFI